MAAARYQKEIVYVDPDFADLIPSFLESRHKDIDMIRESLSASDMREVQRLGHGMKGAGAGYGFPEISRIGSVIEEAAITGHVPVIEEAVDTLAEYLSVVEIHTDESG